MTWDMVREMHQAGFAIGAHTARHPLLGRSSPDRQQREIAHCRTRIEQELGAAPEMFSYPVGVPGSFTAETVDFVRQAGFRFAFGFQGGFTDFSGPVDQLQLPRIAMEPCRNRGWLSGLLVLPRLYA
jgi:peptidoglycan/xylan/chitin deacetylase (PgdA/CDA1 family)